MTTMNTDQQNMIDLINNLLEKLNSAIASAKAFGVKSNISISSEHSNMVQPAIMIDFTPRIKAENEA